ncbi:Mannan polymerase complexes subunit MNN9 [Wickerhamiella sorbophila]|uniref:Mannan polymerase complexes subunit MNN9 n=1 Tax=Wickerhamiella sorbophila TaxID=45607 RepID=A0A2T0FN53_9ASCO|nr:Mannan polymerase complexes subunit MNN9 [Wickerhamiella sorbophila]PRT56428.1 Mannan polymerase complexes subunit MNN9 [Wickerhamiella sorbophila]
MIAKLQQSRNTRSYVTTGALLACGYLFLYVLFSVLVPQQAIGSAKLPKKSLEAPFTIYPMDNIKATSNAEANKEKILVLTPMARFYQGYWDNLVSLTYPHSLIDVGFIVPNDAQGDATLVQLNAAVKKYQTSSDKSSHFRKITILRQDTPSPQSQNEADRHALAFQKERRSLMSLSRNSLLFTTIQADTSWVFWLDADVVETPPTILQDMTKRDVDVLVANCWQRYVENGESKSRPYDFNSWIDSEAAHELANQMGPDDILLEGYAEMATYRTLMAKLYSPTGSTSDLLELDGVGATALLVKADVHRDGAIFPPFAFYHLIESEGFAKMAKRLNYKVYGLPNYLVYHYNE